MVNRHLSFVAKAKLKLACQRRVELNAVQPCCARSQKLRNRTMAGADLDHRALAGIAQRGCDAHAGVLIHQKVLPELRLLRHAKPQCSSMHAAETTGAAERRTESQSHPQSSFAAGP